MVFVGATVFSQNQGFKQIKLGQQALWKIPTVIGLQTANPSLFVNQVISPAYYTERLGYFCKQEIRFEKTTGIPLRFRLGTVVDCDLLEGKYRKN